LAVGGTDTLLAQYHDHFFCHYFLLYIFTDWMAGWLVGAMDKVGMIVPSVFHFTPARQDLQRTKKIFS